MEKNIGNLDLLRPRHLLPMAAEALRKAGSYVLEQVQGGGWSSLPKVGTPPAHIEYHHTGDGETDDDDPHEHEADL